MKRIFVLLACLVAFTADGQQRDPVTHLGFSKEQLLAKGKHQKTAGWILTGVGAPVFLFTLYCLVAIPSDAIDKGEVTTYFFASAVPTTAGLLLIRAGSKNKKAALSFGLQSNPVLLPSLTRRQSIQAPAAFLKIGLP